MRHLLTWSRWSSSLGLIILLAAAAGCGPSSSQAASSYPPIDGIPCESIERVAFHIRAQLAIYAHGQARMVPYGIGIGEPWQIQSSPEGRLVVAGSCFYWLHTHTEDDIIHIESPQQRTFTLGDFFAIWGEPLSSSQVGANQGPVVAYVNGEHVAAMHRGPARAIAPDLFTCGSEAQVCSLSSEGLGRHPPPPPAASGLAPNRRAARSRPA